MNALYYLIESSICAAILWVGYYLLLRNSSHFTLSRAYLLLSMPLSIIIPALNLPVLPAADVASPWRMVVEVQNSTPLTAESSTTIVVWILGVAYLLGCVYFIFRLVKQLLHLRTITSGIAKNSSYKAFTFFRRIYVNKSAMAAADYNQVLLHEQAHATQLHSLDLMMAELFIIVQWFNPFARKIKQSLTEVHEYIADKQALSKGADVQLYKELLFKQTIGLHPEYANGFNYSLIKKRLTMITKAKPTKFMALRLLGVTMTVAALIAVFGCNQSQKTNQEVVAKGADKIIITLESGEVVTLTAGNEAERATMMEQAMAIGPIQSMQVFKGDSIQYRIVKDFEETQPKSTQLQYPATVVVTLTSGEVKTYKVNNEEEKAAMEKEFSAVDAKDIESISILKPDK